MTTRRIDFVFTLLAAALVVCGCSGPADDLANDGGGLPSDGGDPADASADSGPAPDASLCAMTCDDGDPCTADSCDDAGQCLSVASDSLCACGEIEKVCSGVEPSSVTEHNMKELETCRFALRKRDSKNTARIEELAHVAGGYVSLEEVFDNLNRTAISSITSKNADRLKNHDVQGFRWDSGDNGTTEWYPQGITGGSDVQEDGRPTGRRILLVSWYDSTTRNPSKGVRVSLVDISNLGSIHYRHLLLVTPSGDLGAVTFTAANYSNGTELHAGGIFWVGDLLYVAATGYGFRVYDMSRIIEVTHTDDKSRIGRVGDRIDAHAYRYIVPEIARYNIPSGACKVKFSFSGLDRSSTPATVTNGEYAASDNLGRLVSWPIDLETGWLIEDGRGDVRNVSSVAAAQNRMQGALTYKGNYYISSSSQYNEYGRLYRTRPGRESSISAWVYGAEDLYMERDTNRIWTPAEHPNYRDTVSIERLNP